MKIKKSQLKQIIKEEIEATMDEGFLDKLKSFAGMDDAPRGVPGDRPEPPDRMIKSKPKPASTYSQYPEDPPEGLLGRIQDLEHHHRIEIRYKRPDLRGEGEIFVKDFYNPGKPRGQVTGPYDSLEHVAKRYRERALSDNPERFDVGVDYSSRSPGINNQRSAINPDQEEREFEKKARRDYERKRYRQGRGGSVEWDPKTRSFKE